MKTHVIHIAILLLLTYFEAKSKTDTNRTSRNIIYLEVLGIGGYGSINYERIMPVKSNLNIGTRIGISTYRLTDYTTRFNPDILIPVAINGFYGNRHKIEFGIGQTIANISQANPFNGKPERKMNLHANCTIGYRYQKSKEGLIIRCSYTPILEFYKFFRHWAGVSIGYAF